VPRDGIRATARRRGSQSRSHSEKPPRSTLRRRRRGWRNAKHGDQWRNTLATYAYPLIGALPVQQIDTGLVIRVLDPIWATKTETASRVMQRIEAVLNDAKARGHRLGENPARWRGHLENILPKQSKVRRVKHQSSSTLRGHGHLHGCHTDPEGIAARALEFTILTAARNERSDSGAAGRVGCRPPRPGPCRKPNQGREGTPGSTLSPPASNIAKGMLSSHQGEFIFPGRKAKKPLSNGAMLALLERMGHGHITVHGFRSTFRDWAAEQTNYTREVRRDGAIPCRGRQG